MSELLTFYDILCKTSFEKLEEAYQKEIEKWGIRYKRDAFIRFYGELLMTPPAEPEFVFFFETMHFVKDEDDEYEVDTATMLKLPFIEKICRKYNYNPDKLWNIYGKAEENSSKCYDSPVNAVQLTRMFIKSNFAIEPTAITNVSVKRVLGAKIALKPEDLKNHMQAVANVLVMLFYNRAPRGIPEKIKYLIENIRKNIKEIPDGVYTDLKREDCTGKDNLEFNFGVWNFEDKYMSLAFLISNLEKLKCFERRVFI